MKRAWYIPIITVGTFAILGLLTLVVLLCLNDDKNGINRKRAETVISAVYEYRIDHGAFPDSLEELIPKYLGRIPRTLVGQEFLYRANSVDGFFLMYEIKPNYGCGYTERDKLWECSYGD